MELIENIVKFFQSPQFRFFILMCWLFLLVLWLSVAYWTYRDAKSRGGMAFYWGLVTLLFPVFGWLIYLVVRPPEKLIDAKERELEMRAREALLSENETACPACMKMVEKDFLICPHCLKRLKKACPECDHALKLNWTICPYCQAGQ